MTWLKINKVCDLFQILTIFPASFEVDPRVRHSFWSVVVGGTFLWLGIYAVSQSQVQRYLCCKTEREAKKLVAYCNKISIKFFNTDPCDVIISMFLREFTYKAMWN